MSTIQWVIAIAIGCYVITKIYDGYERGENPDLHKKHCMTCGMESAPKKVTKGNFAIELVLWLCFIVPGLIYSIWRVSSRHMACPSCGGSSLVPINSPAAVAQRKILSQ